KPHGLTVTGGEVLANAADQLAVMPWAADDVHKKVSPAVPHDQLACFGAVDFGYILRIDSKDRDGAGSGVSKNRGVTSRSMLKVGRLMTGLKVALLIQSITDSKGMGSIVSTSSFRK